MPVPEAGAAAAAASCSYVSIDSEFGGGARIGPLPINLWTTPLLPLPPPPPPPRCILCAELRRSCFCTCRTSSIEKLSLAEPLPLSSALPLLLRSPLLRSLPSWPPCGLVLLVFWAADPEQLPAASLGPELSASERRRRPVEHAPPSRKVSPPLPPPRTTSSCPPPSSLPELPPLPPQPLSTPSRLVQLWGSPPVVPVLWRRITPPLGIPPLTWAATWKGADPRSSSAVKMDCSQSGVEAPPSPPATDPTPLPPPPLALAAARAARGRLLLMWCMSAVASCAHKQPGASQPRE